MTKSHTKFLTRNHVEAQMVENFRAVQLRKSL